MNEHTPVLDRDVSETVCSISDISHGETQRRDRSRNLQNSSKLSLLDSYREE